MDICRKDENNKRADAHGGEKKLALSDYAHHPIRILRKMPKRFPIFVLMGIGLCYSHPDTCHFGTLHYNENISSALSSGAKNHNICAWI
jgi:hypothetical protein